MLIRESNKCLESSIRKCRFLLKVTFINSPAVEENQKKSQPAMLQGLWTTAAGQNVLLLGQRVL